jgi:hypothetical protein
MDKQGNTKILCRTICIETRTTHMTFLNIDFRQSRVVAKPLLEAVALLVRVIYAGRNATTSLTVTSTASRRLDIEDIVYALYAATLIVKTTKDLLPILHRRKMEMDTVAEVARREMDMVLTRGVDILGLLLTADTEVALLEVPLAEEAVLVAIQAEILHPDATCTLTMDMTEELSHLVDLAALVTQAADLEVIEYHATGLAPGTGAGENAASGYLTKGCRAIAVITDLERMAETW